MKASTKILIAVATVVAVLLLIMGVRIWVVMHSLRQANDLQLAKDFPAALAKVETALKYNDRYSDAYHARGQIRAAMGDDALAILDFDRAIKIRSAAEFLYDRGNARSRTEDFAGAIADYTLSLDRNPDEKFLGQMWINRGLARTETGDLQGAIADFDECLKLNPRSLSALIGRAQVWKAAREFQRALEDLNKAAAIDPSSAIVFNNRGRVHFKLGNHTAAIADYDTAILLDPKYALAYGNRGESKLALGDAGGALADFEERLRMEPTWRYGHSNMALAHGIQRDWIAMFEDTRKFRAMPGDPSDHVILLAWYAKARIGDAAAANDVVRDYLASHKPTTDFAAAFLRFALDEVPEAALFEAAQTRDAAQESNLGVAWYLAGIKKVLAGDTAGAEACFRKSVEVCQEANLPAGLAEAELKFLQPAR